MMLAQVGEVFIQFLDALLVGLDAFFLESVLELYFLGDVSYVL